MMGSLKTVDWSAEISLLRALEPVASRVHVVAAEALWGRFEQARRVPNGERDQGIVTVKLITEAMFAMEDSAALCLAVRNRTDRGMAYQYRHYRIGAPKQVYEHIVQGGFPWSYLRLSAPQEYVNNPYADDPDLLSGLNLVLGSAARWYQAKGLVDLFNRSKHGFFIVEGATASELKVIMEIKGDGEVQAVTINDFREWCDRSRMVIRTCADGWRDLAELVIFMYEQGYDLARKT